MADLQGMRALVPEHLEWMRARNYSEATVEGRSLYLSRFVAWCEERGLTRPQEVTKPVLEQHRRFVSRYRKSDGKPLSFSSQYGWMGAIKWWFKWLSRCNYISYNPASDLELPRMGKKLPRNVLTVSEAEQVLCQPDVKTELGVRDRAILEMFYSTGMRRSELLMLQVSDVDMERGMVMIRQGKGQKDRVVPIGSRAAGWLEKYLLEVRPGLVLAQDNGVVFLTKAGETFNKSRLTFLVRGYVEAAQIGKSGSCHLFRHTMATLMLEGGADLRFVQQMLGHEDLRSTQIYTHVSIHKLKEVHDTTHPGARLERSDRETEE